MSPLKLKYTVFVLCAFTGTLQVVKGLPLFWDTSEYKILQDPRPEDYSYYAEKCRGELSTS